MKTKFNLLLLLAMFCLAGVSSTHAADRTWINASGGGFVGPTTNWLSGLSPGTGDVVLFDATGAPATYAVTLSSNYTFQGLRNHAGDSVTMNLNSNTLTLSTTAALRSSGVFNIQNGTLAAATRTLDFGREGSATSNLSNVSATANIVNVGLAGITSVDSSSSQLTLEAGTVLTTTGATTVGGFVAGSTSANSKLLVSGVGTQFNGVDFRVGTTGSSGNTLEVTNGGVLNGAILAVGSQSGGGGVNTSVLIHGHGALTTQNSKATVSSVNVGIASDGTTSNNSLVMDNYGELVTSGTLIVNGNASNTNNRVIVGNNAKLTPGGTTTVNFGYLEVDGGTLQAKALTVNSQGRFNLLDGTVTVDGTLATGTTGARFGFDLTGDTPISFSGIAVTGNINVVVGNFIDIFGVTQIGEYTLFTYTGTSNASGRFSLGNTPEGFEGSLIFDTTNKQILLNVTEIPVIPEPSTVVLLALGFAAVFLRLRSNNRRRA